MLRILPSFHPESRTLRRRVLCCAAIAAMGVAPGCSLFDQGVWSDKLAGTDQTAAPRDGNTSQLTHKSRNTISLQADFRHVNTADLDESLWQHVDETAFSTQTRDAWLANGFRIGLITTPETLPVATEETNQQDTDPVNRLLATAGVLGRSPSGKKTIPLRPSQRHELPVSPILEGPQVVMMRQNGQLTGRSLDSPQMLLALTPSMGKTAGQITLHIRPEIQHGAVQQRFISSDAATRLAAGRDSWELPEMNLPWSTDDSLTLLIAPVHQPGHPEPTFGLGRQMLRDSDHLQDDQHVLLLLKIDALPAI